MPQKLTMKLISALKKPSYYLLPPVALCLTTLAANPLFAEYNNPPSFEPGDEPTSSACDGLVRFAGWMKNVTDNNGETSQLRFRVTSVTNPQIFSVHPWVSWPSLSLNYQLQPGTPGGLVSEVTAYLKDDGGTADGGSDTSQPITWSIYTKDCTTQTDSVDTDGDGVANEVDPDDDNDGISDIDEGGGLVDTDGDGAADSLDIDSDDDLIPDENESGDTDGDGIRDSQEPVGIDVQTDSDGDGVHDGLDLDDDNDGIIDTLEGAGNIDTDRDGIVDSLDLDSDNDGRSDLLESGLNLIMLTFDASWSLEDDVGNNGLVDLVETFSDSGFPLNYPIDADADGIPDFQAPIASVFSNDETNLDDSPRVVATGLEGFGCTLGGSSVDPVLLLAGLLAMFGLVRRRHSR